MTNKEVKCNTELSSNLCQAHTRINCWNKILSFNDYRVDRTILDFLLLGKRDRERQVFQQLQIFRLFQTVAQVTFVHARIFPLETVLFFPD